MKNLLLIIFPIIIYSCNTNNQSNNSQEAQEGQEVQEVQEVQDKIDDFKEKTNSYLDSSLVLLDYGFALLNSGVHSDSVTDIISNKLLIMNNNIDSLYDDYGKDETIEFYLTEDEILNVIISFSAKLNLITEKIDKMKSKNVKIQSF